ncbi:DUF3592 domain-containing protein [Pleionea sp. CnH1-48]|uniref:DUF3592 domain-containing protein n=1 Tax=Pleionea sp. CnH1-48 TaxID=2954494 RepID=UPI002096A208|nr:DUF3592 domain-containing protein [Pleionea sp. CnH1-48]MCO7225940.1 DUF3592 domain-containing protein [Pleionea sp. CnH1-48]
MVYKILIRYFFVVVGAVALSVGSFLLGKTYQFVEFSVRTQGVVVEHIKAHRGYAVTPLVEFHSDSGEKIRFQAGAASSPPAFDIGEKVLVIYPYHQPDNANIDSFRTLWVGPLVPFFLGICFFTVGILAVRFMQ